MGHPGLTYGTLGSVKQRGELARQCQKQLINCRPLPPIPGNVACDPLSLLPVCPKKSDCWSVMPRVCGEPPGEVVWCAIGIVQVSLQSFLSDVSVNCHGGSIRNLIDGDGLW
eukprot:5483023-Amphidinium_carterae.1